MLYATFTRLRPEGAARLRDWLSTLPAREEEIRASYARQGTRYELFFLLEEGGGPILVTISDVDDLKEARASFLESRLPIDREFKMLMQEISLGNPPVERLYDSARDLRIATR